VGITKRPPEKIREVSSKIVTVAAKNVLVLIEEPHAPPTAAKESKNSRMKKGMSKINGGPATIDWLTRNEKKSEGMNALRKP
jgi:DNA/RNA-binding domain of Phe-tRNA-synthetase-like protein